jgi:hypothetical protein
MKHTYLISIAIIILIGCKPHSGMRSGHDQPALNEYRTNADGTVTWSNEYREKMQHSVLNYAIVMGIPATQRNEFTSCVVNHLETTYGKDMIEEMGSEFQGTLTDCKSKLSNHQFNNNNSQSQPDNTTTNSTGWSKSFKEKMQRGLNDYAIEKGIQGSQVNDFTSCVISTLEARYPDERDVPDDNPEAMAVYRDCQNKLSSK